MPDTRRHESPPVQMAGFPAAILQRRNAAGNFYRLWQVSYVSDYIGLIVLLVCWVLIQAFVEPFHRMFALDNQAIQFPHAEVERVPLDMLFIYAFLVPIVFLAIWALILRPSWHKIHVTYLAFLISMVLTVFITDVIKNGVGRPRPDLIDRCKPAANTPEHSLVTYRVCTEANYHVLHDGFRSFPSGHSSFAFSGLGFLTIFLASQMHVLHPYTSLPALLITVLPLFCALLIAISRCEDYRHDVWDVTAGSTLGLLVAWFTYRRFYPNLRNRYCEMPFPSRADAMRSWLKIRDEENLNNGERNGRVDQRSRMRHFDEDGSDEEDNSLVNNHIPEE